MFGLLYERPIEPSILLDSGCNTVFRYIDTWRWPGPVTAAEYAQLREAGITVLLCDEVPPMWIYGGREAGIVRAQMARDRAGRLNTGSQATVFYRLPDGEHAGLSGLRTSQFLAGLAEAEIENRQAAAYTVGIYGRGDAIAEIYELPRWQDNVAGDPEQIRTPGAIGWEQPSRMFLAGVECRIVDLDPMVFTGATAVAEEDLAVAARAKAAWRDSTDAQALQVIKALGDSIGRRAA